MMFFLLVGDQESIKCLFSAIKKTTISSERCEVFDSVWTKRFCAMDISSTSSSLPNNDSSSVQRLGVAFVPWSGNLSDSNLRDPGFDECCGESGEQTFRKTYAFWWPSMHSYIVFKPDWYYEKCYKYIANPEIDSQPRSLEISDPVRRTNALDL